MSIVLGINANHADSCACIIKDGKLLIAIEEERINRIKHWAGLPVASIKECLKNTGLEIGQINHIAINTNPISNLKEKSIYFFKNYLFGSKKVEIAKRLKKKIDIKIDLNKELYPDKLSNKIKIHYIDHHISHIASAFYPSNFKKAVGLSIDGFGDFSSLNIAECTNGKIKVIEKVFFPDSLGLFYEAFTQLIGFKNYGDEYKVMGLSSYGKPSYFNMINKYIFSNKEFFSLNLDYFNHTNKNFKYKFSGKPNQSTILNNNILKKLKLSKNDLNNKKINTQKKILPLLFKKYLRINLKKYLRK